MSAHAEHAVSSRGGSVEWDVARRLAFDAVTPLAVEQLGLADAIGRVLAHDVVAEQDIPHYASSAMDGWAIAGPPPWRLLTAIDGALHSGEAVAIVTGGVIPLGSEAVLRTEHAQLADGTLALLPGRPSPPAGADIRAVGQEARRGERLIAAGTVLNPVHIAVAASCARDLLTVSTRPRVALLLTGDEVIVSGVPATGKVRDSFGPQLPALIAMLGGTVVAARRVADKLGATITALEASRDVELIITTGGTGSSDADQVRTALTELGAEFLITRVASRPGGPTMLARLPDGRIVVGLAGNPLAAITGVLLLVAPLIAAWSGRSLDALPGVIAARAIDGHERATLLVPYRNVEGGAVPSSWIGSGMMRGLAESAGVLVVPPRGLAAGEQTTVLPLPWLAAPATVGAAGDAPSV